MRDTGIVIILFGCTCFHQFPSYCQYTYSIETDLLLDIK